MKVRTEIYILLKYIKRVKSLLVYVISVILHALWVNMLEKLSKNEKHQIVLMFI